MFGLKWLSPELLAAAGLTAATAGAAAPALAGAAGAGAAGAAEGAGLLGGTGLTLGGVGAAGGSALPGLSLAGATGATGTGLTLGGVSAAAPAAETGLLGTLGSAGTKAMGYLDEANKVLTPVGQAASAANAVSGLFPQQQPIAAPAPHFGNGAGSQAFTGLLQDQNAIDQQRAQDDMQKRMAQQKLLSLIGGGYGRTA